MTERKIVVGTRSTRLALAQAEEAARAIRAALPEIDVTVKEYSTAGDESADAITEIGEVGVFVKRLEEALLAKEIDVAVHSAKDLPTLLPEGLALGALLKRAETQDALISRAGAQTVQDLPEGTRIGTSSPRRSCLLLEHRKDLEIVPIRGSVESRLEALDAGEVDALVLAVAGLKRLDLGDRITGVLDEEDFIPAGGQGAIALEVRAGELGDVCEAVNDADTWAEVETERAFLAECGAGCEGPVGVRSWAVGRELISKAVIGSPNGAWLHRSGRSGPKTTAKLNGKLLAAMMMAAGGKIFLDQWRSESGDA